MGKSKYSLDKELSFLSGIKLFPNIYVYPFVNVFLGMIPCKSDKKVVVKRISIPGYEGYKLSALLIEPRDVEEKLPCIVFYHGGGLILKAAEPHYQFAKWYAEKVKCRVVLPEYRLMPKYRFPYALEDCYSTYKWVIDSAAELNIDENRIIVTGDSAGGNFAAAVTLMARDRKQIMPKGVLMAYPALDRRMDTESMRKYTDTPVLNAGLAKMYWEEMLKGGLPEKVEYASPMEAKSLANFPDTYIEVAEFDSLHDDGVSFADRLKTEGIPVELHEVKGACHGYEVALNSKIVRDALARRIKWIGELRG